MSLFGKPKAKASFDPLGEDREPFRHTGKQAAHKFFRQHDGPAAAKLIDEFSKATEVRFSEWHPDIGRASLFLAVFQLILRDYELALSLAKVAIHHLRDFGEQDIDFAAAKHLHHELQRLVSGERKATDPEIIGETPSGVFIMDLK